MFKKYNDLFSNLKYSSIYLKGMTDGLSLLDLGCGWGSVALFMAEKFPSSKGNKI